MRRHQREMHLQEGNAGLRATARGRNFFCWFGFMRTEEGMVSLRCLLRFQDRDFPAQSSRPGLFFKRTDGSRAQTGSTPELALSSGYFPIEDQSVSSIGWPFLTTVA
jgi:hypothetical protein